MKYFLLIIMMALITITGYRWFDSFGLTGISMLYLLLVVGFAYYSTALLSVSVAFLSFLCINYFFVEPRFTFQVSHVASWTSLLSFLIVSLLISSLVKQLKKKSFQSEQAYQRAELSRKLAEILAYAEDVQAMLNNCAELLQKAFKKPVSIINRQIAQSSHHQLTKQEQEAVVWANANGKPIGPHTGNWPQSDFWVIPFNRLPDVNYLLSGEPVVFVSQVSDLESEETLNAIKLLTDQIALAYRHQIQKQRALTAENLAHEEAIRGALLASIAHDMRTPLTSILGAATTLNQSEITVSGEEMQRLTTIISSQAKHLAITTENILSLIRLESISKDTISMSLQSPEEIVGVLADLYKNQTNSPRLSINVNQADLLISANHDLIMLALTNLIENAKQANIDNHHPLAPIRVAVGEAVDGKIYIQVCDDGQGFIEGFDSSQIKKFESSHNKGFGLGLSIVEAVAKLHHAELTFEKGANSGAVVSLRFAKPVIDLHHDR